MSGKTWLEKRAMGAKPAELGHVSFRVDMFDRDVKESHERPCTGSQFCAPKSHEVVEYALARTISAALAAEYQTFSRLKELLGAKLYALYAQLAPMEDAPIAVRGARHG